MREAAAALPKAPHRGWLRTARAQRQGVGEEDEAGGALVGDPHVPPGPSACDTGPPTLEEFEVVLAELRAGKAAGPDERSANM